MTWIKVTRDSPGDDPYDNHMLVSDGTEVVPAAREEGRWFEMNGDFLIIVPTHWMPYPEPPKVSDDLDQ